MYMLTTMIMRFMTIKARAAIMTIMKSMHMSTITIITMIITMIMDIAIIMTMLKIMYMSTLMIMTKATIMKKIMTGDITGIIMTMITDMVITTTCTGIWVILKQSYRSWIFRQLSVKTS